MLGGELNDVVAQDVNSQLLFLESEDAAAPIRLHVNSPGGSVISALSIVDTMQALKPPISTICFGGAAGAAVLVLACGGKGRRCASPNAQIRFVRTIAAAASVEVAFELQRLEDIQNDLLAMQTGRPVAEIAKAIDEQRSFTPEEAVAFGLIDLVTVAA